MDKIWLKIKLHPPLTKQKLISIPPSHLLVILRSTLPPPHLPPPTCSLLPNLHVGCLPQAQTVFQMILISLLC